MSQVIARRYRPQGFDEVIGQDPIIRTLRNSILAGRVAHGFIFSGHRGIGKTTVARILAKALNCRAGGAATPDPCGVCDSCREIRDGNAVDVIEIDAASNRGIDEIRALRERVRYQPARDRCKFFILDEAHQLTGDAFNALLKTLEEPPAWAVFVLATTEPEALPATIRSRCQHFAFRAVGFTPILEHLRRICAQEGIPAEEEALGLIAEAGEGSVRDALSLLDQAIAHAGYTADDPAAAGLQAESVRGLIGRVSTQQIQDLLRAVADDSARLLLERADALLRAGVAPVQLCRQLTQSVRNALVAQSVGPDSGLLEMTESERAAALAAALWFREEDLARFLQILLRAAADLRYGQQERLHFELGLIKLLHARRLTSLEDVLAALGPEAGLPSATPSLPAPKADAPSLAAPRATAPPAPTPLPRGIPEHLAPAPVEPERRPEAPPVAPPSSSDDPTQAVLAFLESQNKKSLLSIVTRAQWRWTPTSLELVFAGEHASLASLADQPATRKLLAAACLAALRRSPEILIVAPPAAGGATPEAPSVGRPANPAPPGSPDARAEQHPLLQQLREKIPTHVLRTFDK